jgi:hypothetical protein
VNVTAHMLVIFSKNSLSCVMLISVRQMYSVHLIQLHCQPYLLTGQYGKGEGIVSNHNIKHSLS